MNPASWSRSSAGRPPTRIRATDSNLPTDNALIAPQFSCVGCRRMAHPQRPARPGAALLLDAKTSSSCSTVAALSIHEASFPRRLPRPARFLRDDRAGWVRRIYQIRNYGQLPVPSLFTISMVLPESSGTNVLIPVILPPGRLRLSTKPKRTGSLVAEKTIGMADVAAFAASADGGPPAAKRTATFNATRSDASPGNRSSGLPPNGRR